MHKGRDELPPANTRRWSFNRKAAVVEALQNGVLKTANSRSNGTELSKMLFLSL
jgi:hypothetical protein